MPTKRGTKAVVKTQLRLAEGPEVTAEVTAARGILGIHAPPDGSGGYLLTHVATGLVLLRTERKLDAQEIRTRLEALDWGDVGARRGDVKAERENLCKRE